MRSLNLGIVGLALVGGAAVAPQHASADANYLVDLDSAITAATTGGAVVTMENYWRGNAAAGYTDVGGVSTFTNSTNTVSGSGTSTASSEFDVLLKGVAVGDTRAADAYDSATNETQTFTQSDGAGNGGNLLGTLFTITNVGSESELTLSLTIDYLLANSYSDGANMYAYARWLLNVQTRAVGDTEWSAWEPTCGAGGTSLYCDVPAFGDTYEAITNGDFGTPTAAAGSEVKEDTILADGTMTLTEGLDYRFRWSNAVRGWADSANSGAAPDPFAAVPLPAALPMLGAAMAGLGLFAARRRKS